MIRYLLVSILVLLVGCSTNGIEITEINNQINTPKYSITVPQNRGWKTQKNTDNPDVSYMEKIIDSNGYIMRFSTSWVKDERMKSWSSKQVADLYREGEKNNMLMMGSGLYQLKDVKMGKKKVGDKQFFTMDYTTVTSEVEQRASLYLYFPKKTNIGTFFVSLYSEGFPRNKPPYKSFKNEFLETLNSLEMK